MLCRGEPQIRLTDGPSNPCLGGGKVDQDELPLNPVFARWFPQAHPGLHKPQPELGEDKAGAEPKHRREGEGNCSSDGRGDQYPNIDPTVLVSRTIFCGPERGRSNGSSLVRVCWIVFSRSRRTAEF